MVAADRNDPRATEQALSAVFALEPERRLEANGDEAFAQVRKSPIVARLFTKQKLAEAQEAARAKGSAPR